MKYSFRPRTHLFSFILSQINFSPPIPQFTESFTFLYQKYYIRGTFIIRCPFPLSLIVRDTCIIILQHTGMQYRIHRRPPTQPIFSKLKCSENFIFAPPAQYRSPAKTQNTRERAREEKRRLECVYSVNYYRVSRRPGNRISCCI